MHRFNVAKVLFVLWALLLLPWLLFAALAGMAFDGGYTIGAYTFVSSVWTYPISVIVAGYLIFAKKKPVGVLLPFLNIVGVFLGDYVGRR